VGRHINSVSFSLEIEAVAVRHHYGAALGRALAPGLQLIRSLIKDELRVLPFAAWPRACATRLQPCADPAE
jgi:hypothetical protein